MNNLFAFLSGTLPIFLEWLKWVINTTDEEWETISSAWPAPTKTRAALLRAEAKALKTFGLEE